MVMSRMFRANVVSYNYIIADLSVKMGFYSEETTGRTWLGPESGVYVEYSYAIYM